ncbi:hypothetical protein CJ030_MR1G002807 [Morella rubra]|uniref:Uncharacterized protein n=1 Tax=Morella rubra TaxID=262757 RepID=A0A6A1WRD2_9ROSI|nr:hypothetical protein CJ030_MR1G002807 [Morella rubra]
MRFLAALAFSLMLASSSLAADRKVLPSKRLNNEDQKLPEENENANVWYGTSTTVNNHHYIPREDFNGYGGAGGNSENGGS